MLWENASGEGGIIVWSTFHCCLWIRQKDMKVPLPWLFLEQFLSAFRITEKSKDQRKRHREIAHGKTKQNKTNPQTSKRAGISNIYRPNKQTNKNSQKKTRKKKKKKQTILYFYNNSFLQSTPGYGQFSSTTWLILTALQTSGYIHMHTCACPFYAQLNGPDILKSKSVLIKRKSILKISVN